MPAISQSQRRLFAIASHHPEELYPQNRGLAKLPRRTLHDFAATRESGLPERVPHMADGGLWWQRETVRGTPHMADGGKWMQKAFSANPGGLHRATRTPEGRTIPAYRVRKAADSGSPKVKRQAQLAINANPGRYGR